MAYASTACVHGTSRRHWHSRCRLARFLSLDELATKGQGLTEASAQVLQNKEYLAAVVARTPAGRCGEVEEAGGVPMHACGVLRHRAVYRRGRRIHAERLLHIPGSLRKSVWRSSIWETPPLETGLLDSSGRPSHARVAQVEARIRSSTPLGKRPASERGQHPPPRSSTVRPAEHLEGQPGYEHQHDVSPVCIYVTLQGFHPQPAALPLNLSVGNDGHRRQRANGK
eukprot:scaffold3656_cov254-Pinguiococcus_pyrenoidosus.AAC.12